MVKSYVYHEEGDRLVPMTRVVILATGIRSRIALAVALLSISIVSTITCLPKSNMQISDLFLWCKYWEHEELWLHVHTHFCIGTEANIFLQDVPPPVIFFFDIDLRLFFA